MVFLSDAQGIGFGKLLWLIRHSFKVIVLVILYALSNLLAYYALARVDASAYTVLLQVFIYLLVDSLVVLLVCVFSFHIYICIALFNNILLLCAL